MTTFARIFIVIALLAGSSAQADTLNLKNGETLTGTVDKLKDGTLTFVGLDGKNKEFKRDDVLSVRFSSPEKSSDKDSKSFLSTVPKNDSPFQTPRATFERWRTAALRGDIKAMVECYASFKQDEVKKELKKLPKEGFEKMRSATAEAQFVASEPFYQGDRAMMEVNWTKGLSGDSQSLQFILEKNEWKIVQ